MPHSWQRRNGLQLALECLFHPFHRAIQQITTIIFHRPIDAECHFFLKCKNVWNRECRDWARVMRPPECFGFSLWPCSSGVPTTATTHKRILHWSQMTRKKVPSQPHYLSSYQKIVPNSGSSILEDGHRRIFNVPSPHGSIITFIGTTSYFSIASPRRDQSSSARWCGSWTGWAE